MMTWRSNHPVDPNRDHDCQTLHATPECRTFRGRNQERQAPYEAEVTQADLIAAATADRLCRHPECDRRWLVLA